MPRLTVLLAAASLLAAGPAGDAAAQPKQPTRDHAVTYMTSHDGDTMQMRMFYSATTRRQRVELQQGGMVMVMLHDLSAGRTLMLSQEMRMAMEMPAHERGQNMLALPEDMTLSRTGTATVAGHRCTTYRAVQPGAEPGTVCITEDGIMLKYEYRDADGPSVIEATALSLGPQPARLFEVPQGWQTMPFPGGMAPGQGAPRR